MLDRIETYVCEGNVPFVKQQHALISVLEPILAKRFKEKLEGLEFAEHFMKGCLVSPPREVHHLRKDGKTFNTVVTFSYPQTHELMKGEFSVAYERLSFEEYFGEYQPSILTLEDIPVEKEACAAWWHGKFSEIFGEHFKKHGAVTFCNFPRPVKIDRLEGVDMLALLPSYTKIANMLIRPSQGMPQPFLTFDIPILVRGSYAMKDKTLTLPITIQWRDYDATKAREWFLQQNTTRYSHL